MKKNSQNVSQKVNKPEYKRKKQKQQTLMKQEQAKSKVSKMNMNIYIPNFNDMPGSSQSMLYNL